MKTQKTKINYKDGRGTIRDILSHTPFDAITFITSKAGAVRGNHYHKKSLQYDYILKGSMLCVSKIGKSKKQKKIVKQGEVVVHPVNEQHAYKAIEDTEFISITRGPRNGENYEDDVYRLTGKEILIA